MSISSPRAFGVTLALVGFVLFGMVSPASAGPCQTYPPSQEQCPPSERPSPRATPTPSGPPSERPSPHATPTPNGPPSERPSPGPRPGATGGPGPGQPRERPAPITLSASSVSPGGSIRVLTSGWAAITPVRLELHSTPVVLGTYLTDRAGVLDVSVTIPKSTPPGLHRIVASGLDANGRFRILSIALRVEGPGTAPSGTGSGFGLPRTGTDVALLAVAGLGLLVLGSSAAVSAGRRRRQASLS